MHGINGMHLQLKLIEAQIFESSPFSHFTLCITSKGNQYHTSTFNLADGVINLKSCSPIVLSLQENTFPFLKVAISSCDNTINYQTHIDYKVIEAILMRANKKQRHILAFPIFKNHSVVGELKIKLTILESNQPIPTKEMRSLNSRLIVSQADVEYFEPVYSRMIKVSIYDNKPQQKEYEQEEKEHNKEKTSTKYDVFEPFKEQISEIELKQNHEARLNQQEQREMAYLASQNHSKQYEQEQMPDIPQDCRHLFQKINQINRRYAPLEKIPSQEEFSDYSELNEGDYRINSDADEQVSHPLQQVQQILKQLDLYKFAQTLTQPQHSA